MDPFSILTFYILIPLFSRVMFNRTKYLGDTWSLTSKLCLSNTSNYSIISLLFDANNKSSNTTVSIMNELICLEMYTLLSTIDDWNHQDVRDLWNNVPISFNSTLLHTFLAWLGTRILDYFQSLMNPLVVSSIFWCPFIHVGKDWIRLHLPCIGFKTHLEISKLILSCSVTGA